MTLDDWMELARPEFCLAVVSTVRSNGTVQSSLVNAGAMAHPLTGNVEVHDEPELERALAVGAELVGVNQRDLVTFEVDHDRAVRVGRAMPDGVVRVAESGIRGPEDAASLAAAGFHAVLVGESVVTAADRAASVAGLRAPRS